MLPAVFPPVEVNNNIEQEEGIPKLDKNKTVRIDNYTIFINVYAHLDTYIYNVIIDRIFTFF